ncbi:MAG: T9SS type A sorting domain-containing protein [Candidatus Stahlbacteria bacterium]|nr:T9SS type A sorting domain-containing protein [Candidatus Stahlbacteria bacterium]
MRGIILSIFLSGILNAGEIVLTPCEDIYIRAYGGTQGFNAFMKFNISAVPLGKTIDSVFLKVYVWYKNTGWDGDVNFWNVHNQDWVEGSSGQEIYGSTTSDSMGQFAGFGMQLGWTKSITLRRIFNKDYNVGNVYCTIKMKDPDDMSYFTTDPPIDDTDSLGLGVYYPLFHYIYFYPHEHNDSGPKLCIYSEQFGVEEIENRGQITEDRLEVYPNPFSYRTSIKFRVESSELKELQIYDLAGRFVKSFLITNNQLPITVVELDGTNLMNNKVHSGIYFCKAGNRIKRLILVR